ncbi:MAG: hypothetical protein AAF460_15395 [Pseudomonadota bacterium]
MVLRPDITTRRSLALVLALCTALYQSALSAHALLHWHPTSHHTALPSFAKHLEAHHAEAHDDAWLEHLLCTLSASGAASKACTSVPSTVERATALHGIKPIPTCTRPFRAVARALPPARAPPGNPLGQIDVGSCHVRADAPV